MRLDVPYAKQDTGYSCGAASVQMVLAYHGIRVSEARLMALLGTNKSYGTHHQAIIELIVQEGLYCYVNTEGTLDDVRMFLDRALPVLVHYIEPDGNEHHYSVAVGYDQTHVTLHDPWNGEAYKMVYPDFLERWRDDVGDFPRWYLVASPEDLHVGKQYHPRED
jgi:predicted double-glycine peptidase